ncbi:hypothetical protein MUP77_10515 [Candidatus Bathyarchaeota archaeon]|nr:hypothetical protein [Candidatus Bathyarchaeota archaeon]
MSSANLAVLGVPLPVIPNPTNIDKKIIGFDTEFLVSGKKRVDGDLQSAQFSNGKRVWFYETAKKLEILINGENDGIFAPKHHRVVYGFVALCDIGGCLFRHSPSTDTPPTKR